MQIIFASANLDGDTRILSCQQAYVKLLLAIGIKGGRVRFYYHKYFQRQFERSECGCKDSLIRHKIFAHREAIAPRTGFISRVEMLREIYTFGFTSGLKKKKKLSMTGPKTTNRKMARSQE